MQRRSYFIVNGITWYRLVAAPVLIILIFTGNIDLFKWLLAISFSTDMIVGYLARRFKVISRFGSRLDSIADDITIVAALIGVFVLKHDFAMDEIKIVAILFALFVAQNILALIRYHKQSSFHSYLAKIAALLQGCFLILIFFTPQPILPLFYAAAIVTALDLIEEIILILILPKWETDVKGLFWIMRRKKKQESV